MAGSYDESALYLLNVINVSRSLVQLRSQRRRKGGGGENKIDTHDTMII